MLISILDNRSNIGSNFFLDIRENVILIYGYSPNISKINKDDAKKILPPKIYGISGDD